MRSILAALALSTLPCVASAECGCLCQSGQAVGICTLAYETPPICQRLCTPTLSQSIGTPNLSVGISPDRVYASPVIARSGVAGAAGLQSRGTGVSVTSPDIAAPNGAFGANATGMYGDASGGSGVNSPTSALTPNISAPIQSYNLTPTLGSR